MVDPHPGRDVFPRCKVVLDSGKGMVGPKKVLCAEALSAST